MLRRPPILIGGGISTITSLLYLTSKSPICLVESMNRAILLQTDATTSKQKALSEFSVKALETANFLLSKRKSKKLMELHKVCLP